MTATTYTVGNFKGGVGKTKIVTMLGYDNAIMKNRKTLVLDLDPQANASQVLAKTADINKIEKTITNGIQENSLVNCITPIMENLDLIACDTSFRSFSKYVISNFQTEEEQITVLANLLAPLKEHYDDIFIDVPPTISDYSDNAMAASDYSIIAFQTQEESLDGISKYINYQNFMVDRYDIELQVIAIVACMLDPDSQLDTDVLQEAKEMYDTAVLDTIITYQNRLKRYSREGIYLKRYNNGNFDQWDFKAHQLFTTILNEIEARRNYLES
ncbi:ParA family protein [Melissococcus plutonius]|uniref:Cobyrinic acid a,c-diamide synthase n=2 Tax=Melissococcus plutonius TaxID=33970 RepID=F3YCL5_MELPT|nr:ParA family protein [Melissococcus plutonius]BAL62825.1 cobyrinic acid a,c-diamide synthase [Melissococcus plutonius DAT561]AIM26063.1 cobyrinic acid a,c-diamide synthase [Melissococcus plutonius S1]KMT23571.1 cobyrinic acid a,c-diamide synthase [Melissococcus plutonius]KMT23621.1 cobyrinic acid a,c-diamide synthase [Melissococcus plutonius]KMT24258.1 cobyrinic acid a,c-diamide synthase [Melissococcus plutonius]